MEYTRKQLANVLNEMGYRTRNRTRFDNTSMAHILKKLKIYSRKTKLITYKDRRTGSEQITQCYMYTEEDKNKIVKYAQKTYKNINNTREVVGKQIEIPNIENSNNKSFDNYKFKEIEQAIKGIKDDVVNSILNIKVMPEKNEYYYKGAYEGLQKMYNELSSKYDNLHSQYTMLLEKNAHKSFWRR